MELKRHPSTYYSFYSPYGPSSLYSNVVYEVRPCTSTLRDSFVALRRSNSFQMNLSATPRLGTLWWSILFVVLLSLFLQKRPFISSSLTIPFEIVGGTFLAFG